MRLTQVREILNQIGTFYGSLAEYYGRLRDSTTDSRVKLLLEYRYKRDTERGKVMADYSNDAAPGVGDAYVNWRHASELFQECKRLPEDPELTIAGVTRVALDVDLCLLRVFADVAARAESEELRDAFTKFAEMEENEIRRHARNAQDAQEL